MFMLNLQKRNYRASQKNTSQLRLPLWVVWMWNIGKYASSLSWHLSALS
ncbi:hypothetical protein THERMOT_1866 [Bathymodiolus thermophilus thioautotrophic gill symbiont]|nr:hypothetical protein THERMOT_1866 [Bathymodiolus thermophilus thioautotrophic gill symbiont]